MFEEEGAKLIFQKGFMKYSDLMHGDMIIIITLVLFWISLLIWNSKTDYPILTRMNGDSGSRTTKKFKNELSNEETETYKHKARKMRFYFSAFWVLIAIIEFILFKQGVFNL